MRECASAGVNASAVLVAAGSSERMGRDKLLLTLGVMTVLERSLLLLQRSAYIDEIVVVTTSEKIPLTASLARGRGVTKLKCVVEGGSCRMESALRGVRECSPGARLIAIHDGDRPLTPPEVIERAVLAASVSGAAAPAVRARDTVRQARGGRVIKTLERDELYLMQTPQVFEAGLIRRALEDAVRLGLSLTDDCAAVMLLDAEVTLVEGSEENLKLTVPGDMTVARAIMEERGEW